MKFKAVLFDLDGTLLDRDASLARFVRDQYDRFSRLHGVDRDRYVRRFIELDRHGSVWKDEVYRQLVDELAVEGLTWETLLHDYVSGFHKHCIGFPRLEDMLAQLQCAGIRIALISNGFGQFQYDNFRALRISQYFDAVLISEWEGVRKPDPAIFMRALTGLGVKSEEAIFVGDHPIHDIQASRRLGMRAVWKRNGHSADKAEADAVIDDLGELVRLVLEDGFDS